MSPSDGGTAVSTPATGGFTFNRPAQWAGATVDAPLSAFRSPQHGLKLGASGSSQRLQPLDGQGTTAVMHKHRCQLVSFDAPPCAEEVKLTIDSCAGKYGKRRLKLRTWCAGSNTGSGGTTNGGSSSGAAAYPLSQPGTPQPMRSSGSPRQQSLGRRYSSNSASGAHAPADHGDTAENAVPPLPPPDSWAATDSHRPQGMVIIRSTSHTCA